MAFPRVSCMCVYVCMCAERTVQYVLSSSMVLSSSTDWPRTAPRPKYESHVDEAAAPSGLRSLGDATETPEHAQIDRRVQVTHISRIHCCCSVVEQPLFFHAIVCRPFALLVAPHFSRQPSRDSMSRERRRHSYEEGSLALTLGLVCW